ncbi:MAG: hypothetical protein OHK0039_08580 [Bacteroidia bacterium]
MEISTNPQSEAFDTIRWYHYAVASPLRLLASSQIGPLGGENSISAVIEGVLALQRGEQIDFELSKTDRFFVAQLTKSGIPDSMTEYRELNHLVQEEVIRRRRSGRMGVIWLGAGVFTQLHPLLGRRQAEDWHVWTDKHPKVFRHAYHIFEEMQQRGDEHHISFEITLPEQIDRLNDWIRVMSSQIDQLVISAYGLFYALTPAENKAWLSRLKLPVGMPVSFTVNSPGSAITFLPGVMAAFHRQRMVYYDHAHIEAIFAETVPGSRVAWARLRPHTRNNLWGTWLVERPV